MRTAALADAFVIKAVRGLWYVETDCGILCCSARGRLRSERLTPLVGDHVSVTDLGGGKGSLEAILPRKNAFVRPAVANLDALVILASAAVPVTEPFLIDRMIAIAELKGCQPVICWNKSDLARREDLVRCYREAGFTCLETSAVTGEGIEELTRRLEGTFCAFTGNSGVGKSSLLNAMQPSLMLPTGEISDKLGRGRHTTRHVEVFRLGMDIRAADTPGFSAFDAEDVSLAMKQQLPDLFREFRPYLGRCRFADCGHGRDEGCAVRSAVESGLISESRYHSYLMLKEELKDLREWDLRN